MRKCYIGVGGKARKVKAIYIGVGGKARKVIKAYIGVNGKARKFWPHLGTIQKASNFIDNLSVARYKMGEASIGNYAVFAGGKTKNRIFIKC